MICICTEVPAAVTGNYSAELINPRFWLVNHCWSIFHHSSSANHRFSDINVLTVIHYCTGCVNSIFCLDIQNLDMYTAHSEYVSCLYPVPSQYVCMDACKQEYWAIHVNSLVGILPSFFRIMVKTGIFLDFVIAMWWNGVHPLWFLDNCSIGLREWVKRRWGGNVYCL